MDDIDIYRSAKLLMDQYGPDAMSQGKMRVDAMVLQGDMEGARIWKRIMRAIAELQGAGEGTRR